MRKIFVDDGAFQRTRHGRLEDLAGRPEAAPIGEVERAVAGIDHDRAWTIHARDHHQVGTVHVHGVDTVVGGVCPVHLLLGPIVRDALGVDSFTDQHVQISRGRSVGRSPRDLRPRTNLSEQQLLVLVIEVHTDYVRQIADGRERHIGVVRVQIDGANLSARGEHHIFIDVVAGATVGGEFAYRTVAKECCVTLLREGET